MGIEKRDLMGVQFTPQDLEEMMQVKDVFDPKWLLNPAKVFPLEATATRRASGAAGAIRPGPREYLGQYESSSDAPHQ